MKKLNYLILPVFFFGLIYYLFFNQIFQWKTHQTESENRMLAVFPELNINQLDKFPREFDTYLDDNFTFRVPFLNFYHELKFQMKVSPNKKDVLIGKNGHFFIAQKDHEIFSGKFNYTEEKIDSMINVWEIRKKYLKEKNILFYWLIAPNKHHVYPEYLPPGYSEKNRNRILSLQDRFNKQFPSKLIYPLDAIVKHKDKRSAYFKQDNHWSNIGAFIAYEEVMKSLKNDFPEIKMLKYESVHWKQVSKNDGNLLNFLGKEGELSEISYVSDFPNSTAVEVQRFSLKTPEGFPYPWDYEIRYKNENALNKKKVLVIRDSFGGFIMPFFNETFSEILYIFDGWKYGLNKEIIELFQPDIIVFLTLETHTDNILSHPPIIDKE